MDSDDRVAGIARRSRLGRSGHQILARLRDDARRSGLSAAIVACRARLVSITPSERFRLAGVLIVTAIATNAFLLQWSPAVARPAAPTMLSIITATIGVLLIVLAEPVARAWGDSWFRRQLTRAQGSTPVDNGRA